MPGDGFDLVLGTSGFGEPARSRLAQAMRRAMVEPSLIAALPEPVPEMPAGEWSPNIVGQKG
jgi:hypothetical protein